MAAQSPLTVPVEDRAFDPGPVAGASGACARPCEPEPDPPLGERMTIMMFPLMVTLLIVLVVTAHASRRPMHAPYSLCKVLEYHDIFHNNPRYRNGLVVLNAVTPRPRSGANDAWRRSSSGSGSWRTRCGRTRSVRRRAPGWSKIRHARARMVAARRAVVPRAPGAPFGTTPGLHAAADHRCPRGPAARQRAGPGIGRGAVATARPSKTGHPRAWAPARVRRVARGP